MKVLPQGYTVFWTVLAAAPKLEIAFLRSQNSQSNPLSIDHAQVEVTPPRQQPTPLMLVKGSARIRSGWNQLGIQALEGLPFPSGPPAHEPIPSSLLNRLRSRWAHFITTSSSSLWRSSPCEFKRHTAAKIKSATSSPSRCEASLIFFGFSPNWWFTPEPLPQLLRISGLRWPRVRSTRNRKPKRLPRHDLGGLEVSIEASRHPAVRFNRLRLRSVWCFDDLASQSGVPRLFKASAGEGT